MIDAVPTNGSDTRGYEINTILTAANQLLKQLTIEQVEHIKRMLRGSKHTQAEVANWIMQEHKLLDEARSSTNRAVGILVKDLLTPQTQRRRRNRMQGKNATLGRALVNFSEAGKKGAATRAQQFRDEGKNAAGHDLWTEAELAELRPLLDDPQFVHKEGRYAGKFNTSLATAEFLERHPETTRNTNSVRIAIRRLLESKNGESESTYKPWDEKELQLLRCLLELPSMRHIEGRYKGKINKLWVVEAFFVRDPETTRTPEAVHAAIETLLYKQKTASTEVFTEVVETM